jgi:hypothetical protein
MISVQQLVEIVGCKVQLKRIGRLRWQGLCPFHAEKTPSFQVWQGKRGEGRYHCHGCGADGDAFDWMRTVEKSPAEICYKPDPELRRRQEEERQHEQSRHLLLDVYPDLTPEAELFLGNDDPLTTLKFRLRRHLAR